MIFLRSVGLKTAAGRGDAYPFSVPVIRTLPTLSFNAPVTFFVGENGSGKSTLLEGMAVSTGLPVLGAAPIEDDETLADQRRLAAALRLTWHRRTHRGFFLRAEDFFGYAKSLSKLRGELLQRLQEVDEGYRDRSPHARALAAGPAAASLADMERRYGVNLDANSHGQSFFHLFRSRFVPGGLYLLDEPETPLSPQSQLGLIAMLKEMVAQDAQFIVATHSPILLAFPGAQILTFDDPPVHDTTYDALDHVSLTREFLQDPERFLRRL